MGYVQNLCSFDLADVVVCILVNVDLLGSAGLV